MTVTIPIATLVLLAISFCSALIALISDVSITRRIVGGFSLLTLGLGILLVAPLAYGFTWAAVIFIGTIFSSLGVLTWLGWLKNE